MAGNNKVTYVQKKPKLQTVVLTAANRGEMYQFNNPCSSKDKSIYLVSQATPDGKIVLVNLSTGCRWNELAETVPLHADFVRVKGLVTLEVLDDEE